MGSSPGTVRLHEALLTPPNTDAKHDKPRRQQRPAHEGGGWRTIVKYEHGTYGTQTAQRDGGLNPIYLLSPFLPPSPFFSHSLLPSPLDWIDSEVFKKASSSMDWIYSEASKASLKASKAVLMELYL